MKIIFLAHSLDHIGGTIRATINTASALTHMGHDVEIVAVFKRHPKPKFAIHPGVTITTLLDSTTPKTALPRLFDKIQKRRPSRFYPAGDTRAVEYNALTDKRVSDYLRRSDADVIIGTRPGLNVYVARFAPPHAATIGQEHLFYDHHKPQLRDALAKEYSSLDALVTVSSADANNYRVNMPHLRDKVHFIPNSIVPSTLEPSTGDTKMVVAAGRIESSKRFHMLIEAFAVVHRTHPDWKLRIYGYGRKLKKLRSTVAKLGLGDAVSLMGQRTPLDPEWVKGSIAAMTSAYESFGLTLVEAMDNGLPVVSTACNYGPPEIISDGVDGLLTPVDDTAAFADALCRLIDDDELRHKMAKAAREKARDYHPETVGAQYVQLFEELTRPKVGVRQRRENTMIPTATAQAKLAVAPPQPRTGPFTASVVCTGFDDLTVNLDCGPTTELVLTHDNGNRARFPATDDSRGSRLVRLDSQALAKLQEGCWTFSHGPHDILPGVIDSRKLLAPCTQAPSTVAVPFATDDSFRLRVWRRPSYAEVETVAWNNRTGRISGRFIGRDWQAGNITLTAKHRDRPDIVETFTATVDSQQRFRVEVDAESLAQHRVTEHDLWDLWLHDPNTDADQVRVARFFDDIALRKYVQRPGTTTSEQVPRTVRLYFNIDNELSMAVKDKPAA
ncbi:MAG TPA: glycosyltransferase family 4 protein [Candidatus Stackebrandtia faecavium]|nr:glycosyltransferase family 4 protein [Candidatus Stackebrandtia faecavium]